MSEQQVPVLNEHQSHKDLSEKNPTSYQPTPEEKKAIKLVNKLFDKAKNHRRKYDEKWLDYYRFFRGKQWKETRPSYRHSEVINFVFQSIQSVVPIITDARPKIEFLPQDPSDTEFAKILDHVADSDWQKYNWNLALTEIVYDAHFYGAGLAEVGFDAKAEFGMGAITFESEDPFFCFPDPNATDVNKRSDFFIVAKPEDVSKLKREYPDKAEFIKADLTDLMRGDKTDFDQVRFRSPVDTRTVLEGSSVHDVRSKDQALKITAYIKDHEFNEEEHDKINPDGSVEKEYVQKLKYPNGRKICMVNGVLLSDDAIPYEDGKFPFSRLLNYVLPREFWGISEVEQLESPQKIFNKLLSFALDVLTLMGNPIWIVDSSADIDTDNLYNRPGLVVEKAPGSEVRRESGVQLQPYVLQLIDRMAQWFDGISGANEVTRGVRPDGITAASAIQELNESSQTRLRLKSRNLDAFLQDVGQQYKSRVFQFYSAPRIIRLTNDQNANKYFKFHIDTMSDNTGSPMLDEAGNPVRMARIREYIGDGIYSEERQFQIRGDFDVRVSTGSSLPFAKTQKFNLAKALYDSGAIDEIELLKAAEYPNAEAVWQRVKEAKLEQAKQEAMAKSGNVPTQTAAM